ncbi:hypothetical protein SteCoe_5928 [Stentor coeruleus]|uniref:Uncharacterized protein n=1 Tax=Stentor coeruleus TaxID=5963 RepID=A0A1R2CRB6_9CILI|nr:hypothetical protein SteCoe_5928 [Stentor coeruleus]
MVRGLKKNKKTNRKNLQEISRLVLKYSKNIINTLHEQSKENIKQLKKRILLEKLKLLNSRLYKNQNTSQNKTIYKDFHSKKLIIKLINKINHILECYKSEKFSISLKTRISEKSLLEREQFFGEEYGVYLDYHSSSIVCMILNTNNQLLITGSCDHSVRLLNMKTKCPFSQPIYHDAAVTALALSVCELYMAVGTENSSVFLYSFPDLTYLFTYHISRDKITSMVFTKNSKYLVVSTFDGVIRMLDTISYEEEWNIPSDLSVILHITLGQYSNLLLSSSTNKIVTLWDLAKKSKICEFKGHNGSIIKGLFIHNDSQILTGGLDLTFKLWDISSQNHIKTYTTRSNISTFELYDSNKKIVYGDSDYKIILCDLPSFTELSIILGHSDKINCILISNNKKYLLSCSGQYIDSHDSSLCIWDLSMFSLSFKIICKVSKPVCYIISYDEKYLLVGSTCSSLLIFRINTCKCLKAIKTESGQISALGFSICQNFFCIGYMNGVIEMWGFYVKDLQENNESYDRDEKSVHIAKKSHFNMHESPVTCLVFSKNGVFVSSDMNGDIYVWDLLSESILFMLKYHKDEISRLLLIRNDKYLVSSSRDKNVCIWDMNNKKLQQVYGCDEGIIQCFYIDNNELLMCYALENVVFLRNIEKKRQIAEFVHSEKINGLCIYQNSYCITSSNDKTIRIWNISTLSVIGILSCENMGIIRESLFIKNKLIAYITDKAIKIVNIYEVVKSLGLNDFICYNAIQVYKLYVSWVKNIEFYDYSKCVITESLGGCYTLWCLERKKPLKSSSSLWKIREYFDKFYRKL